MKQKISWSCTTITQHSVLCLCITKQNVREIWFFKAARVRSSITPILIRLSILENVFFPFIEANSGAVKRLGRSDAFATEFDLEAEEYVPLPKGDVHKRKEVIQDVTLHDLDVANARPQGMLQLISRNILTIEISRKWFFFTLRWIQGSDCYPKRPVLELLL